MMSGKLKLYHWGALSENVYMERTKKKKEKFTYNYFSLNSIF